MTVAEAPSAAGFGSYAVVASEYAAELCDRFLALEQELAAHPDTRISPGIRERLRALGYAP